MNSGSATPERPNGALMRGMPSLSSDRSVLVPTHDEANAVRMNVLNSSVQEARDARSTRIMLIFMSVVSIPQIIASIIILALNWNQKAECDRVKCWTMLQAVYLSLTLLAEWLVYNLHPVRMARIVQYLNSFKSVLEFIGLFWFLVGNMWVISDQEQCAVEGTQMYQMALALIIIAYIKICLPCLILMALVPVVCCCLPCLIRVLSRFQDPMRGKGATKEMIQTIPSVAYTKTMFPADEDASCCICLNEYTEGQQLRSLRCGHHFHQECVDEWLVVNATCPTCRTSIDPNASSQSAQAPAPNPNDPNTIV